MDEAVRRWLETEPVETAAAHRDISSSVLFRLLREAVAREDDRIPPKPRNKKHWRIPSVVIDELVAPLRTKETLTEAAKRVGVGAWTLSTWLRRAGVVYTIGNGVQPGDVDRVVAENRARPGCRAWLGTRERRAA